MSTYLLTAYISLSIGILYVVWHYKLDTDSGGYKDSFKTIDKLQHFIGGFIIELGAESLFHISPSYAIAINVLNGLGYEIVQAINGKRKEFWKYAWRDWTCDNLGITLAWLLRLAILTALTKH